MVLFVPHIHPNGLFWSEQYRIPMQILPKAIAPDWGAAIDLLEGAYSENTLRGYRVDFRLFDDWCRTQGLCPLPAEPATVAGFIATQSDAASANTLKRRLASIREVHRLFQYRNPAEDEVVLIAMRRALRAKASRPHQALGLTADLRDRLMAVCPDDLAGLRDRALIAVGYDTLCRRSELASLRVEDLQPIENGGTLALIRRAKNDPFGSGREGYISPDASKALSVWLDAADIRSTGSSAVFMRVELATTPFIRIPLAGS